MCFQKYEFLFSLKKHESIRIHTAILMHFPLSTLKQFENDRIECCDVSWTLRRATNTGAWNSFRHHFHFDTFGLSLTIFILIHFKERFEINAFS